MKFVGIIPLLILALVIHLEVYAQNETNSQNIFLRVYSLEGKKIYKGTVISVSDSLLKINRNGKIVSINRSDIGMIKTKHSGGNNVLIGSLAGATLGAIAGAASAQPDAFVLAYSAGEGAGMGAVLGGSVGALIGGITVLAKKTEKFDINGDLLKWKEFLRMMFN